MDIRKNHRLQRCSPGKLFIMLLLLCCAAFLVRSAPATKLEQVRASGELRVLSRNGSISYYQGPEGITGFEYTLLKGFADELGVKLILKDEAPQHELLQASDTTQFDLASPTVINSHTAKERFDYSASFLDLSLQLIYNSTQAAPADMNALGGKKVLVVNKASVPVPLAKLQASLPDIHWQLVDNIDMTDLLDLVERGHADYALVDSAVFAMHRYSYPHTQVAFDLPNSQPLSWAFTPMQDKSLYQAAQKYLAKIQHNGQLAQISAQFFDQFIEVNTDDALVFSQRLTHRFPRWEGIIKAAAAQYHLDWQLLAAIGYQESHWIPNAESPTGVRGFMMLTPNTAKELGVQNLEDPKQSIYGGAKYLRYLLDTLPESISGDERLYMALAAYNQGIGHLADARALTRRLKGDPNNWQEVSKAFPLLARQEYYSKATYGYARGGEPVIYVRNVLNYQKILAFRDNQQQLRLATSTNTDELKFADNAPQQTALEKLNKLRLSSASTLSFL